MQPARKRENIFVRTLRVFYPVAKYLAVLLISLNLHRLPRETALFPGVTGPRWALMLWPALLLTLAWLADKRAEKARNMDAKEKNGTGKGIHLISFLAIAVPGLLLLDAAAVAHLYFSWFNSEVTEPPLPLTVVMAVGCVLWIYGRKLPSLPYGSIWGLRAKKPLRSETQWQAVHTKAAKYFCAAGALCLAAGAFL